MSAYLGALLLVGCHTMDSTKGQSGICEIHHIQMTKRTLPVSGGNLIYDEKRERFYPHPGDYVPGSCFPGPDTRAVAYVCLKCQAAEQALSGGK